MNTFKGYNVDLDQIKQLMAELESSKLKKLMLKKGDFELHLEKEGDVSGVIHSSPRYVVADGAQHIAFESEPVHKNARKSEMTDGVYVTSPMVGTFYASPAPQQPAFVKVGDLVTENTVVCIVEAMKVMNEVKAGTAGTIAEVLIATGHPVEFGSKLFRIVK